MLFTPSSLILRSYSKINASLRVLSLREDGYHELEMVFLPLELHDVIEISRFPNSPDTFITCDDIGLANQRQNLCMKAIDAMRKEFGFKEQFNVHIHKEIPYAAGLGGGSSNAATVMQGLVKILNIKTDVATLKRIALGLGADVPYFFSCQSAKVTGIGDKVEPFYMNKSYYILLVKPKSGLKTTDVYKICDKFHNDAPLLTTPLIKALQDGDEKGIVANMANDLYAPANSLLPEVGKIIALLHASGFPIASMTGSGSACFAMSQNAKAIKDAAKIFEKKGYTVIVTKTLN
jgi:4-diphosphocytidyl-2C-methyl-D-erythritol kinase